MSNMSFYRRPVLGGKNLNSARLVFGKVRGSLRRNNPDVSSVSPYFSGVTSGQTLIMSTQAGSATATFNTVVSAGLLISQAITDINTALGVNGQAYDDDGVIALQSAVAGGAGSIQVTGGTAAVALGFDTSLSNIYSTGGDMFGAPEGRGLGNLYGTTFLGPGEGLTSDVFVRSFGALSSNLDVLYSELVKEDAVLTKLGTLTAASDGKSVTPGSTVRVFNAYNSTGVLLSRTSLPEELAPFFVLTDPTTNRLLPNRIVAVVAVSAPVGDPPYADAANPTDTGKNLLGLNLTKFSSTAITTIKSGTVINCTGCGTGTAVGDIVGISGATNTAQWSNNGTKWIIESIIDANNISVRPMALSELIQLGTSLAENQPVLELNTTSSGSFGNLTVYSGMYSSGVSFVVRPALSASQSVVVWATVPTSVRSSVSGLKSKFLQPYANKNVFRGTSDSDVPLQTRRYSATNTGHLFDVLDDTGAVLTGLDTNGNLILASSSAQSITKSTGSLTIGTSGTTDLILKTNGNTVADFDGTTGNLKVLSTVTAPLIVSPTATNTTAVTATGTGTGPGISGTGLSAPGGAFNAVNSGSAVRGAVNLSPQNTPSTPVDGDAWVDFSKGYLRSNSTIYMISNPSWAGMKLTVPSSLPTSVSAITYSSSIGTVGGDVTLDTTNSHLVFNSTGLYKISLTGALTFNAATGQILHVIFDKNGTANIGTGWLMNVPSGYLYLTLNIEWVASYTAADYLDVTWYTSSGTLSGVTTISDGGLQWSAHRIA